MGEGAASGSYLYITMQIAKAHGNAGSQTVCNDGIVSRLNESQLSKSLRKNSATTTTITLLHWQQYRSIRHFSGL